MEGILVSREKEEVAKSALLLSMESTVCRNVIEAMCETALFRCLFGGLPGNSSRVSRNSANREVSAGNRGLKTQQPPAYDLYSPLPSPIFNPPSRLTTNSLADDFKRT